MLSSFQYHYVGCKLAEIAAVPDWEGRPGERSTAQGVDLVRLARETCVRGFGENIGPRQPFGRKRDVTV